GAHQKSVLHSNFMRPAKKKAQKTKFENPDFPGRDFTMFQMQGIPNEGSEQNFGIVI
ncbi:hypothetical protein KI387_027476, partial [Taxus chinensis]